MITYINNYTSFTLDVVQSDILPGGGFHSGGGQTDTLPGGGFHSGGGQTDTLPGGGFHSGGPCQTIPLERKIFIREVTTSAEKLSGGRTVNGSAAITVKEPLSGFA